MSTSTRKSDLAAPVGDNDHVLGLPDARVAIVEYGDFECPACAQAAAGLQIIRQRFDADACLVFRHYPLISSHPHSMLAAEAAEAAAAQGRFWAMHDLLFRNELHLGRGRLLHCARIAGLDLTRFERELDAGTYRPRVEADIASGKASHVMSTPAIFLNGELCDVSFGLERLEEKVAHLL